MLTRKPRILSFVLGLLLSTSSLQAAELVLGGPDGAAAVLAEGHVSMRLAADLVRRDLQAVIGKPSAAVTRLEECKRVCIVIGRHDSALLRQLAQREGLDFSALKGGWERYERVVVASRARPGATLLVIAGSDTRGAIYGAVDLTRELGVSAWEWWADVKPAVRSVVTVGGHRKRSDSPSVQYRGVFLNDEDWGLQPWAAKTFDRGRDIGPATYARIFELLWRLKANLVWPAMHDITKPFYEMAGNAQTAHDYAIVVGTSHAEPMMRNNVREWKKSNGAFNFFTNRNSLVNYWEQRVEQVKGFENMYSMGIRGVHDSAMEGARNLDEARAGVTEVIDIQRNLLSKAQGRPARQIPQALTLYKEVLDIYNGGLKVPDDITLIWPDDNYGYLHQLSRPQEAGRSGGTGLYYHISYWGRPHDYLWLGTTHPGLIRDQLQRAISTGTQKTWVLNVGDIKPAEYLTQYFFDLAFDRRQLDRNAGEHLKAWMAEQFGPAHATEIAAIMLDYYNLAWERRPEFMGFSQTEPTTPTRQSDYLQSGGEEAERRLARYDALVARAQAIGAALPEASKDAYFQLVLYPVRASANLNSRILKLDLAAQYARMGRPAAQLYARQAQAAQAAIGADTAQYNSMSKGKWRGMMDAAPRRLPVFVPPTFPAYALPARADCALSYPTPFSQQGGTLAFTSGRAETKTLTVIQYGAQAQAWSAEAVPGNLKLSVSGGTLNSDNGFEQRIDIAYDGTKGADTLRIQCGSARLQARLKMAPGAPDGLATEHEKIITLPAAKAVATAGWSPIDLGSLGTSMRSDLTLASRAADAAAGAPALTYEFFNSSKGEAQLKIVAVPVHPLTSANKLRIAVTLDGESLGVHDFATHGRSDEWKNNVLSNTAVRVLPLKDFRGGRHKLTLHALDPGFVLDRIELSFEGAPKYYGAPQKPGRTGKSQNSGRQRPLKSHDNNFIFCHAGRH